MAQWSKLSGDVQLLILEDLALDSSDPNAGNRGKPPITKFNLSRYASVCRSWQTFFEKRIYHTMWLTHWDLDKFSEIIQRQRHLVEHIKFEIGLPDYDCQFCSKDGPGQMMVSSLNYRNDYVICKALPKLFATLSNWDSSHRLALEIRMSSPSDLTHSSLPKMYIESRPPVESENGEYSDSDTDGGEDEDVDEDGNEDEDEHEGEDGEEVSDLSSVASQGNDWVNEAENGSSKMCLALVQGMPAFANKELKLSEVKVVDHLILCRQTRQLMAVAILPKMLSSLSGVRKLSLEVWRPWLIFGQQAPLFLSQFLINILSNPELKEPTDLTIFEDFNEDHDAMNDPASSNLPLDSRPRFAKVCDRAETILLGCLTARSFDCETFHVSYLVDAMDFLYGCAQENDWVWEKLTVFSMTSRQLFATTDQSKINALFKNAGITAGKMIKIKRMEIWNGAKGSACVLRFSLEEGIPSLEWKATWKLELEQETIEVWKAAAQKLTGRDLVLKPGEFMDEGAIASHAVAIRELGLSEGVIRPLSLEQIRRETEQYHFV